MLNFSVQKEKYLYYLHCIIEEKIKLWQEQIMSTHIFYDFSIDPLAGFILIL